RRPAGRPAGPRPRRSAPAAGAATGRRADAETSGAVLRRVHTARARPAAGGRARHRSRPLRRRRRIPLRAARGHARPSRPAARRRPRGTCARRWDRAARPRRPARGRRCRAPPARTASPPRGRSRGGTGRVGSARAPRSSAVTSRRARPSSRVACARRPTRSRCRARRASGRRGTAHPVVRACATAHCPRCRPRPSRAAARPPQRVRARVRASARPAGLSQAPGYCRRMAEPLLVRVARREPVERTPVLFMRQAGRSLPEYRALRERHDFFELAGTPELCAEVTLQPVRRHGVDAAVLFADIMPPVVGMGIGVELVEGVGPVVDRPVASMADVGRLSATEPDANVLEAVRLVRRELDPERAVIGFCGGPFTVAGYLVEGKPSRDFARTKALMYREPDVWHALMDRLAEQFARYVAAQVRAGADVIQLFDSWVGALSSSDYAEY